jgi:PilZ domain
MHGKSKEHPETATVERRKSARFPLGLPVRVHLTGHPDPITVEVVDLSTRGGRFRCLDERVQVNQTASFAFVLPGERHCTAKGRVVRADDSGEFAIKLSKANRAFLGFLGEIAAPAS